MRLVFAPGRIMYLYMWNRQPFMSASDWEMVCYATRRIAKALAEAPPWLMIEKDWITDMQRNNIWSLAFEACTQEILKEECWSNSPHWILQTRSGIRFEHKSTKLYPILFNQQWITSLSMMISTSWHLMQSVWTSLIPFWQTRSVVCLWQSMRKVVYTVQIPRRECRKLLPNGDSPLDLLAEGITGFIYLTFHHWAKNRSKAADGFYNSTIDDMDGQIPLPLIMFTCTALRHALLEWQKTKMFLQSLPSQSCKRTDLLARTASSTKWTLVTTHPSALQRVASY